ncbi:MAG: heme ABC transporter ATP-binding protein [Pseudomonadota bacterium]
MLEARSISLRLGGRRVLEGVSIALQPGRVTAVVGPNGAGKSTLLGCLTGALRPESGTVRIDGDDPVALGPAALGLRRAVLDQTPAIAAAFTLAELVELGIPRRIAPADTRRIVARAAAAVGLEDYQTRRVDRLSGGERHRAHMARTLAQLWAGQALGDHGQGGRWLLLDEPTASLDLRHQQAVLRAARDAAAEGAGVLVILHDLTLAAAIADRIAVMDRGRLVAEGTVDEVMTPERLSPVYGIDIAVTEPVPGVRAVNPVFTIS